MEERSEVDSPRTSLAGKLKLMDELWGKLAQAKWNRQSFGLMERLARDVRKAASALENQGMVASASQLEQHVEFCLQADCLPEGDNRTKLESLLRGIHESLTPPEAPRVAPAEQATPKAHTSESVADVVILGGADAEQTCAELGSVGFQVRHVTEPRELEAALTTSEPRAIFVDLDLATEGMTVVGEIGEIRARTKARSPFFFLGERDDLEFRLAAVRAGASGYLRKPTEISTLLAKLNGCPNADAPCREHRVLLLLDRRDEARKIAGILEDSGIATEMVAHPAQALAALQRFRPDLVLLDLGLKQIDGPDLLRVLRQHDAAEQLPILLLCEASQLESWLPRVQDDGDDLLGMPVIPEYLSWIVRRRLRSAMALRAKVSSLTDRDAVSGLYNRQHFLAHLETAMAMRDGDARRLAVMLIMLDNLRAVRESSDVATSDAVLRQAARRVQKTLGADVQAARFGDGIFAAVIEDADKSTLLAGAIAVRTAIESNAYRYGGHSLHLTACVGIGVGGGSEQNFLTLIQDADLACSLARESDAERVHIHEPLANVESNLSPKQDPLDEIRSAIAQEQMNLLFQPIVSLRGDHEERYEVLLRMRDSNGRELLPEAVFGIAQHHELGLALDRWVIAECIGILGKRRERTSTTTLFVNLLPATLEDDSAIDWLQEALARDHVDGERIVFEVAEADARTHLEQLQRFMQRVTSFGCRLSLERFGRGADSMRLLNTLTPGYVKLDAAFVQDLVGSSAKQQQLRDLVQALEQAGAVAILGGVENLNTLPVLWSCGINFVQGYFLQRPHEKMSYDFAGGAF